MTKKKQFDDRDMCPEAELERGVCTTEQPPKAGTKKKFTKQKKLYGRRVECACGKLYPVDGKADHDCTYISYSNREERTQALKFIRQNPKPKQNNSELDEAVPRKGKCKTCLGTGSVEQEDGCHTHSMECSKCSGTGKQGECGK